MKTVVLAAFLLGNFAYAAQETSYEAWNQKIVSVIHKFAAQNLDAGSVQCENQSPVDYPGRYDRCTFSMKSAATKCYVHATHGGLNDSGRINWKEQNCNYAVYRNTWHVECRDANGYGWRKYLPRPGAVVSACVDNVYTRGRK